MEFEPSEVKEILKVFWDVGDRRSVLLLGGSGIGKTTLVNEVVREIAEQEGLEFVEVSNGSKVPDRDDVFVFYSINLSTKQPYDLDGIPRDVNDKVFRYKVLEAFEVMKGRKGVIFIDEVTNVRRDDMHSALYSLFQFRRVGDNFLGNDVWVIGAGNRKEDSRLVVELSDPEINRTKVIYVKKPSVDSWAEWMDSRFGDEWDRTVYAFLKRYPDYAHRPSGKGRTLEQWPSYRNWTDVAVYGPKIAEKSRKAYYAHVVGLVGKVGLEFLAFRELVDEIPKFEEVVKNPIILKDIKLDVQYLFAVEMVNKVRTAKAFKKYDKLMSWLAENKRELMMLWWEMLPKSAKKDVYVALMDDKYSKILDIILASKKKKYELG